MFLEKKPDIPGWGVLLKNIFREAGTYEFKESRSTACNY